ncbi:hypothetical protein SAMN04488591_1970 [Microbacterium azadirachtae]|uniref:DNA helicase n=1 Tax=Microbacterium azadirachtae TaxID=582680 RepID=A0A1I6HN60_9MICO|nr:DNA helicase [Microbacterium azadirachtae]SFR55901.1 hypothetical protein SAMN04488591_1970 [Microbacterium azadirachtae]
MSLSRKRQKELRQLQSEAAKLWAAQQVVAGDAASVAREAGRQLDNFRREQVLPAVQDVYEHRVVPVVDRGLKMSRDVVDHKVVPAIGGVVGSALTAWDIANAKRTGAPRPAPRNLVTVAEPKRGPGIGSVIAIILGAAAAVGVLVAAWQALRADDELWVADDPLNAPEA